MSSQELARFLSEKLSGEQRREMAQQLTEDLLDSLGRQLTMLGCEIIYAAVDAVLILERGDNDEVKISSLGAAAVNPHAHKISSWAEISREFLAGTAERLGRAPDPCQNKNCPYEEETDDGGRSH